MTLNDKIRKYTNLTKEPNVGRLQELSVEEEEEAIVECLRLCAEFKFPMRKCEIQKLMHAYMLENAC
jgi:hypothetical protein